MLVHPKSGMHEVFCIIKLCSQLYFVIEHGSNITDRALG